MSTDQDSDSISARKGLLYGLIFGVSLGSFFGNIAVGIALGVALGCLYDGGYLTSGKGAANTDADPASQRRDEEGGAPR